MPKGTSFIMVLFVALSIFAVFPSASEPAEVTDEYVTVLLQSGKTVSHIAAAYTRSWRNWEKLTVLHPTRDEVYPSEQMERIPAGARIRVPKSLIVTAPVEIAGQTIEAVCAAYAEANCVNEVSVINGRIPPGVTVNAMVHIPKDYRKKQEVNPASPVAPAKVSPAVATPTPVDFQEIAPPTVAVSDSERDIEILLDVNSGRVASSLARPPSSTKAPEWEPPLGLSPDRARQPLPLWKRTKVRYALAAVLALVAFGLAAWNCRFLSDQAPSRKPQRTRQPKTATPHALNDDPELLQACAEALARHLPSYFDGVPIQVRIEREAGKLILSIPSVLTPNSSRQRSLQRMRVKSLIGGALQQLGNGFDPSFLHINAVRHQGEDAVVAEISPTARREKGLKLLHYRWLGSE